MRVKYIAETSWKGFQKGKMYWAENIKQWDAWVVYGEGCKIPIRGNKDAVYVYDHRDHFVIVDE